MTTTTMHFGPEWMRTKHQVPARAQLQPPSPSPASGGGGTSTYSALVSPAPQVQGEKGDEANPFRYSKEEMLRIYSEGGGKGGLGLEVERWEGVVRETGTEPVGLREMGEAEKKLFATSLNSELRRRQSTDYLSNMGGVDRPRLNHAPSAGGSGRGGFSSYMAKRRDSTDQPPSLMLRRPSHSSSHPTLNSPSQASPRGRVGFGPSFDGVLNGGDSWSARRKTAEVLGKPGANLGSREAPTGTEPEMKVLDVHEEEGPPAGESNEDEGRHVTEAKLPSKPVDAGFADPRTHTEDSDGKASAIDVTTAAGPPPGLPDLTGIEWSYLDPQGNVQGPFQAHVMQKWHDEGYFSLDLPMRRTHIDSEWIPLGELIRRVGDGGKLFLSPATLPRHSPLPGRAAPNLQGLGIASETLGTKGPHQPAASRPFRASTLDSPLATSALSDPASSSFKYSTQEAAAFHTATTSSFASADPLVGNRVPGFAAIPEEQAGYVSARQGTHLSESLPDPSLIGISPLGSVSSGQALSVDGYGFGNAFNPNPTAWSTSSDNQDTQGIDLRSDPMAPYPFSVPGAAPPAGPLSQGLVYNNRQVQDNSLDTSGAHFRMYSGPEYGVNELEVQPEPPFPTKSLTDERDASVEFNGSYAPTIVTNAPLGPLTPNQRFAPSPSISYSSPHRDPISASSSFEQSLSAQSPWGTQYDPSSRRPGPFDSQHPPTGNTNALVSNATALGRTTQSFTSPWGRSQASQPAAQPSPEPADASPWGHSSQNDGWQEAPSPKTLTFSNVGQHNQQQEQDRFLAPATLHPQQAFSPEPPRAEPVAEMTTTVNESKPPQPPATAKPRRRATAPQLVLPEASTIQAHSQPPLSAVEPAAVPLVKQAWASDDPKKGKQPATMSLREIQGAEAKKAEMRKAAEKERGRAARVANHPSASDDVLPFSTPRGLPTSQVGAAHHAPPKDTPSSNPSTPSSPPAVWTNAAKAQPVKKTMKEIQEEEEKRKKFATRETAAVSVKKALTEPAIKPHATQLTGNAWATVGAGGKVTSAATHPNRPPPVPSAPSAGIATNAARVNGLAAARPPPASGVTKPAQAPAKADDPPAQPSHDFLKWLADTLKGLNNAVNIEEITSMLLSFPIDPDASTMEIISDLIYANSTTLDGRRFASDFVSRRKADVASRPKGAGSGSTGKPISIADVVKAQPKPTQPEWGGFKVVNKKKKGGRP